MAEVKVIFAIVVEVSLAAAMDVLVSMEFVNLEDAMDEFVIISLVALKPATDALVTSMLSDVTEVKAAFEMDALVDTMFVDTMFVDTMFNPVRVPPLAVANVSLPSMFALVVSNT